MGLISKLKSGLNYVKDGLSDGRDFLGEMAGFKDKHDSNPYKDMDPNNFRVEGYDQRQDRLLNEADRVKNRQTPVAGRTQIGQMSQAATSDRALDQGGLIRQLQGMASGQDSMSREMLRQGAEQSLSQQQALMQSGRGGASAGRAALKNAAQTMSGLAGQQALAGIQERQSAIGQLGGVLSDARGADERLNMFNTESQNQRTMTQAQMDQQRNFQNQNAELQNRQINDSAYGNLSQQELSQAQMQQQSDLAEEQIRNQRYTANLGVPSPWEQLNKGVSDALPSIAGALSDKRTKTEIKSGDNQAKKWMEKLRAYTYRYKDQKNGRGEKLGVMAQDLEQGGSKSIKETSLGKMIDLDAIKPEALAAIANLNKRLKKLEKKGK